MKRPGIGLVYDLRSEYLAAGHGPDEVAEFDTEDTIDALASALERLGHPVDRVGNGRALAARLAAGDRFDIVFSIAEGLQGRAREAQVPALCELYGQAYVFSDPLTLAVCLDKAAAKRIVRDNGIATAPFVEIAHGAAVPELPFPWPVFVKPVAEGTGKGCESSSVCDDREDLERVVATLTERFRQGVIVERYLPGREFTVGIVGEDEVAGVMEIVLREHADAGIYSYRNKEHCESLVTYRKADDPAAREVATRALAAYRALGCRDAARLDFRCDETGTPVFLEANPLAGLHPLHSDLPIAAALWGHGYDWLVARIMKSAMRRCGLETGPRRVHRRAAPLVTVMHAARTDRPDEADTLMAADAVAAALERRGFSSDVRVFAADSGMLEALARDRPHAVFNLVEAIDGQSHAASLAPWWLKRHGLAFSGNGFEACVACASKLAMKGTLLAHGLPTPALTGGDAPAVIVKPVWEHASVGIDARSVVPGRDAARACAERTGRGHGAYFAEAFIDGREFNVSLLERFGHVEVLPVQETLFVDWPATRPRVVDFDAKWQPHSPAYRGTPRRFGIERDDPALAARLRELAEAVWTHFGLGGYARVDLRVNEAGKAFVIDVNANPGLGPDAGFVAAAAAGGLGFEDLVAALVDAAREKLAAAA